MKFSKSLVSTGIVCAAFSASLSACGGGSSNSNPGAAGAIGGQVGQIAAGCPNTTLAVDQNANAVTDQRSIPGGNYELSRFTVYVYNPNTGDSISAHSDARDGFNAQVDCNQTAETGRHSENASAPESLGSSSQNGQDLKMTIRFDGSGAQASSQLEGTNDSGFDFSHMGRGRELTSPGTYVTYQTFISSDGSLEVQSKTELPADSNMASGKLIFTAAEYRISQDLRPGGGPGPGPGPGPGQPHRN